MKKKATLNDIAKILNLTKVSISKALRDHPDISDDTKMRVRKVAQELGYRPNLIARSLTSSRSMTLGVVVPKIAHNFFGHVLAGIQQVALREGYEIVLTVSDEKEELEQKHIESLVSMQVEGLLVSVSMETRSTEIYNWLKEMQVPLVFFDRHIPDLGFNSVVIDDEKAAENGVNRLIEAGYRNIVHLSGYTHNEIGKKRRKGYEKAMKKYGLEISSGHVFEGGFGEEDGYRGFKEILSQGMTPDALFAVTVPVGLGAYIAMREIDPALMNRIPVLAFGDSTRHKVMPYPQYYIHQPGIEIGKNAAELLFNEIKGIMKPDNLVRVINTEFIDNSIEYPVGRTL